MASPGDGDPRRGAEPKQSERAEASLRRGSLGAIKDGRGAEPKQSERAEASLRRGSLGAIKDGRGAEPKQSERAEASLRRGSLGAIKDGRGAEPKQSERAEASLRRGSLGAIKDGRGAEPKQSERAEASLRRSSLGAIKDGLLDGAWYADDPHEIWRWMRREAPVFRDDVSDVWGIARYADVLTIERDPVTFSSHRAPRPHGDHLPMMISMDNPDHQRRRSLVSRGFTPRRVAAHRATVERLCTRILDDVCERGECDFVWDVAAPLPLLLIADLLGFDETLHHDLISTLCHATVDGEVLGDESIVQETLLILIGGDETTRHVISGGMIALLERPDQAAVLRSGDEALRLGVEELLRWVSPVKNMARTVTRDVELRGEQLRAGDQLMLFYPSANRDEEVFDEPDRLDVRRDPNPHLAFGFGSHFCLGASLARLELTVMFGEVLRRLPGLRLVGDDLPYRQSNFITGPEAMPVEFTPTARVGRVPDQPSDR